MVGSLAGKAVLGIVAPPPVPPAGSVKDEILKAQMRRVGEELPIVRSLSTDPNWISHDAYANIPDEDKAGRLTSGPLAAGGALGGFQRVFSNRESGEVVTVIFFGPAVSGWPGVVHGGVTSTVMDEQLGRCAVKTLPAKTGVTATLDVNFLKPVFINSFYVIRALPQAEGKTDTKCWVNGRLETLDGQVCAEAKALYVVPKKFRTRQIADNF